MADIFENASADTTPQDIKESASIKRIIYVLSYYSKWLTKQTNQNDLDIYQSLVYMNDDQNTSYNIAPNGNLNNNNTPNEKDGIYSWISSLSKTYNLTKLLDDFHYILFFHSSEGNESFEELTKYIKSSLDDDQSGSVKNDEIDQSIQLIRNNRNRYKYSQNNNLRYSTYCGYKENKEIVTQQILDSIYSFLLFTFDFGYRFTSTQKESLEEIENDDDALFDKKFKFILDEVSKNKLYAKYKKPIDNDDNKNNDAPNDDSKDDSIPIFDCGISFYYWQDTEKGAKDNKWSITPKYKSFKEEIEGNKFGLNKDQWNDVMIKSESLLDTNMAKILKATSYFAEEYGVEHRSPITITHIVALLLYTNFRVKIDGSIINQ